MAGAKRGPENGREKNVVGQEFDVMGVVEEGQEGYAVGEEGVTTAVREGVKDREWSGGVRFGGGEGVGWIERFDE